FKHEAFGKFKEWKKLVENQIGGMVKKLRKDNGLEFCNREFKQLCIESGIARHLTVDETSQQNGLAKQATYTVAYLMSRSPSTAIEKKTPMKMWSGHPSGYGMLRIFYCVTYLHDKQDKIELRAVKRVLLGYPEGVKEYRLYRLDNETPKIVTSRNVVFNESVMYKDTLKDSGVEAVPCEDSSKWKAAMKEEMDSLRKNNTWELVDHPAGQKLIKKGIEGGQKLKYKARLVAYGFTQRAGIDYNDVFSPLIQHTSIQVILALTVFKDYELEQLDSPRQRYRRFDKYMLSNRFQSLLSQLETHSAGVSTKDANKKFLRVFESDVKGFNGSSSSTQNVAFVSSDNTSSTNEVNIAYGVSISSGHNSQKEGTSSYTDDLMYSFFANQSSGPQLDHEDLEQVDEFDLEKVDLKWQVAMISTRQKKFYKKTRRKLHFEAKEPVGFDKSKVECFNFHNTGHFARECISKGNQDSL
nr:retrotransposon protein, putative, Ty1-copia subclass [Tanacetum cinerariifolium]